MDLAAALGATNSYAAHGVRLHPAFDLAWVAKRRCCLAVRDISAADATTEEAERPWRCIGNGRRARRWWRRWWMASYWRRSGS